MNKMRELLNRIWPDERTYEGYTFVHPDDPEYDCGEPALLTVSDEEYDQILEMLDEPIVSAEEYKEFLLMQEPSLPSTVRPLQRRWLQFKPNRKYSGYR